MTERVSVAHIITKLELGGAQQITLFTVANLNRSKFHPIIITGEPGMLDLEARNISDAEFYQIPSLIRMIRPFQDFVALLSLTSLLKRIHPTIVHTHSSKAGIVGRWAARLAGVPIIIHSIHGYGFTPEQHPIIRRVLVALERSTARFTSLFFTDSESNRRQGVELGLFPAERSFMLPPGIDLTAIRQIQVDVKRKKQELGLDPARPVVGMVAPFKPQKAPLDFVWLTARVIQKRPDVQFLLVGDGELRPSIEQEIRRYDLSRSILLLGWRQDVPEIMRCLDAFVLTSRWEGLPRVYLEALTSGIPVVGTRVDGAAEVVQDGVNGYLLEPGDVAGLADRVLWLLNHPDEAKRMGHNGESLSRKFDSYEVVRQQERHYEGLVGKLEKKHLSHASSHATQTIN